MIVTLDGRRIDREFTPGCTLQTLIDELRGDLCDGRLVVSVAVDGHDCDESELEDRLTQPLGAEAQVDLESGDRCALSVAALRYIGMELRDAGQRQADVADQLNAGQTAEAVGQIGEFVQTWQTCRTAVVQCSGLLGRNLTEETFNGQTVERWLADLVQRLREVRDALDARDMVLLADLIHYEMPALCETWHNLLMSLADGIADAVAVEV